MTEQSVTVLLDEWYAGVDGAGDKLSRAVQEDLRRLAAKHLRNRFGATTSQLTLQPTALVNETWIKILKQRQKLDNRGHFFAIATRLMIRVLCDYIKERNAVVHGGGAVHLPLPTDIPGGKQEAETLAIIDLESILKKLESINGEFHGARKADVVRYRIVWGFSIEETANALGVGHATVERDWAFTKSWMAHELEGRTA